MASAARSLARSLARSFSRSYLTMNKGFSSSFSRSTSSFSRISPFTADSTLPSPNLLRGRSLAAASVNFNRISASALRCFSTCDKITNDFEKWLVVMDKPEGDLTRDQIIDSYIETLAMANDTEVDARNMIYSVSTKHYFAFGAYLTPKTIEELKKFPTVRWVLPDTSDGGGEPFIDGQAVPYDPKYHEEWVRNSELEKITLTCTESNIRTNERLVKIIDRYASPVKQQKTSFRSPPKKKGSGMPPPSNNTASVAKTDDVIGGTEKLEKVVTTEVQGKHSYVSQSAVGCRVMPPPCISNPYLKDTSGSGMDPFSNQRSKCAGFFPSLTGGDGQSRYRSDFHEIEEIGNGNFSHVFKVLNRIDGCMYAVKKSTKVLHNVTERRKALMEVQALAALGFHENLVGYYSSWFENEKLFIQMELCDHSLSISKPPKLCTEGQVLDVMHQIAKALVIIHERGIAHLDLKPENIYKKNGIYKLGDFGCTTLLDKSLPIEEVDARYMPREILNDNYDHLEKVDIFSLGITIFELIRGATLPESGPLLQNLRQGKLPLLPGHTVHFQSLLKAMMDPDPIRRPSARELVENPIFDRCQRSTKAK